MSEVSEISRMSGAVVRRWPIVVVAVVVGALLMAGWGATRKADTSYSSSSKVRIGTSNLPNMPTIDILINYAGSPAALAALESSAGVDTKGVKLAPAADPKVKTGIVITAKAPDEDRAFKAAQAAGELVRAYGLAQLAPAIKLEEARTARLEARADELMAEISRTRTLSERAADPAVSADYLVAAQNLENMYAATTEALDVSRFAREGYLSYVTAEPASAPKRVSGGGVLLSDVLRGGLIGLFIGALIAALLERRTIAR